ncbi:MAG: AAA family ATPase [Candidatus Bathyarchaeia archaeon]
MSDQRLIIDEGILDINYIPSKLLYREEQMRSLRLTYDFMLSAPYEMSQRAIIVGGVGSGKTAIARVFGKWLRDEAKRKRLRVEYIHVNCRELRGSLFMVLRRVVKTLRPEFPERGYAPNELIETLMQILGEDNEQLLLCLDEVDTLIDTEGSDALYQLTRVHETQPDSPRRLSLLLITKDRGVFEKLDRSTLSSLQRNLIEMSEYSTPQLSDIVSARAEAAFRRGAVPLEVVDFIAELASSENGDARCAIDLLWGAGKKAERDGAPQVRPEHVRQVSSGVLSPVKKEGMNHLSLHERLTLLSVARFFRNSSAPQATTGEVEQLYRVACEERGETPRAHTQFWKYLENLKATGIITSKVDSSSQGRTQLITLGKVSAEALEREVLKGFEQK